MLDELIDLMSAQMVAYLGTIYALRPDLRRDDWAVALYREDGLLVSQWATYVGITHGI